MVDAQQKTQFLNGELTFADQRSVDILFGNSKAFFSFIIKKGTDLSQHWMMIKTTRHYLVFDKLEHLL